MPRMILAGIDEAGLGPNLGPLATACAALRVPDGWSPDSPREKLTAACTREWRKTDARLCVADSKIVYTRGGMTALEKTLAAFAPVAGEAPAFSVSAPGAGDSAAHPCYSCALKPFPLHCGEEEIAAPRGALRAAFAETGAEPAHLEIGCLFETTMNSLFASGLNKNQILLRETGARLAGLAAAFPEERILAVIDKQGGRNEYLPFLTRLFPGEWIEVLKEGAAESSYRIRRPAGCMELRFAAKGDRDSFATALASMAAKYARERAIEELNSWFRARVPGLKKTAGYPLDAKRWRADVENFSGAEALMPDKVWRIK